MRILAGLLRADAGTARLLGGDPWHDGPRLRARLGYLPSDPGLYGRMTGAEVLDHFARLGGSAPSLRAEALDALALSAADLARQVRGYSRGMRQKVAIAQALQHDPELLVLDEPSEGLDPLVQEGLFALLRGRRDAGRTVFLSSHVLPEVERLCEQVALIRAGRIVDEGTIEQPAGGAGAAGAGGAAGGRAGARAAGCARGGAGGRRVGAGPSRAARAPAGRARGARPPRRHHRGGRSGGDLPRLLPRGRGVRGCLVVLGRLAREQRVRLPLVVLFAGLWGFLLVALFATSDSETQSLSNQPGNLTAAFRLVGLDPLAAWVTLGQAHPLFLLACGLFAIGLGVRAIAGELEAGTLELTLSRPLRRSTYLAAHVLLLAPGALLIALAYATGTMIADRAFDPPGDALQPLRMVAAALLAAILVLALGGIALLASAFHSERGRALGWADRRRRGDVRPQRPVPAVGARSSRSPGCRCSGTSRPARRSSRATSSGGTRSCSRASPPGTISAAFWRFARRDVAA